MKVISYNIHKGFSFGNRKFVLAQIRNLLTSVNADLHFLQEVLGEHKLHAGNIIDWPAQAQFEFLAAGVSPYHAYGKNAVYEHGHHGNAILSKYNFNAWENIDISTNRYEKRGLLHVVLHPDHSKTPVHAICLHLDLLESGRQRQIEVLCERVRQAVPDDAPLVIAGDFNDWRTKGGQMLESKLGVTEAYKSLHGDYARTFPSWLPLLQLDRIYFRGLKLKSAQCLKTPPWNQLSDHGALLAEFQVE